MSDREVLLKRSLRRHHRYRLWAKRRYYWGGGDLHIEPHTRIRRVINTPCLCSCVICGNARKYLGEKTLPEYRQAISESEYLIDLSCGE